MKLLLRKALERRVPRRERSVVVVLVVVLGIGLYAWFGQSVGHVRQQLQTKVTQLRTQAGQVEQQSAEIARLRVIPALAASQTNLHTLVQEQAGTAGLTRALVKIDASNADQVTMVFGAVAFADWLKWIADLKVQHIRVDSCRIEALSTAGLVNVTATLIRAIPQ